MLLLQATVTVVPEMSPPVEMTSAYMTKPIELYECRMVGIVGEAFNLNLRKEGEQGFYSDQMAAENRLASRTPPFFRILKDDSGRFSAMTYVPYPKPGLFSDLFRDGAGNSTKFRRWGSDSENSGMLEFKYYPVGSSRPQVFAGPCKITRIPQMPLDRDPTKGTK